MGGGLRDGTRDGVREADEILFARDDGIGLAPAGGLAVLGVEENQVNVRTVVKLVRAEFSERGHRKAAPRDAAFVITVLRMAVAFGQLRVAEPQRFVQDEVGQRRELERGLAERRKTQHVLQHNANVVAPLETRQLRRKPGVGIGGVEASEVLEQIFFRFQFCEITVAGKLHRQTGLR